MGICNTSPIFNELPRRQRKYMLSTTSLFTPKFTDRVKTEAERGQQLQEWSSLYIKGNFKSSKQV